MRLVILRFLGPRIQEVLASTSHLEAQPIRFVLLHVFQMVLRSHCKGLHEGIQIAALIQNLHGTQGWRHRAMPVSDQSDQCCCTRQSVRNGSGREACER